MDSTGCTVQHCMYSTVLQYSTVCTVLYCTAQYCTVQRSTVLYILSCTVHIVHTVLYYTYSTILYIQYSTIHTVLYCTYSTVLYTVQGEGRLGKIRED